MHHWQTRSTRLTIERCQVISMFRITDGCFELTCAARPVYYPAMPVIGRTECLLLLFPNSRKPALRYRVSRFRSAWFSPATFPLK
jgi:hypothetical protein